MKVLHLLLLLAYTWSAAATFTVHPRITVDISHNRFRNRVKKYILAEMDDLFDRRNLRLDERDLGSTAICCTICQGFEPFQCWPIKSVCRPPRKGNWNPNTCPRRRLEQDGDEEIQVIPIDHRDLEYTEAEQQAIDDCETLVSDFLDDLFDDLPFWLSWIQQRVNGQCVLLYS